MKKKNPSSLIAIVAIVAVVIFAGCMEEKSPTSVSTQDLEYIEWAMETLENTDTKLLAKAMERGDYAGMERYAGMLYDAAKKALNEIDQFSVSPEFQPSKDEYTLALQDLKQAAYYTERWARNNDVDDIETATEYFKRYSKHLDRFTALLPKE